MENSPLYNSSNLIVYLEYIEKYYPEINISEVLKYAGMTNTEIQDAGQWFNQDQIDRFYEILVQKTGNRNLAREVGRYMSKAKQAATIRNYAAGFITPSIAFWMLDKLGSNISKHLSMSVKNLSSNKVEITVTTKEGVKEKLYQCENRIGLFEALAQIFTGKFADISHRQCIHQGDPACKYIISWKTRPSAIWKLIATYSTVIGFITSLILFFAIHVEPWIIYTLSFACISTFGFFMAEKLSRKDLNKSVESQQIIGDQLMKQSSIRYNELALIKEIGEAASSILDPQQLLNFVVESLQKRLEFNRGMIMLANPEKTKLVYTIGYGYTPEEEILLKKADFTLTNPQSTGIFYLAYRDKKPFLINNTDDIKNKLSEKSSQFMIDLGIRAFICVPIIYKGNAEGILAVDGSKMKTPLTQSDLSLLTGITTQIGISLNNALAHKKLKESEERFRNLSDNSPDIIYRLSKLGTFTYTNTAWEDILGHSIQDILGKQMIDFIDKNDHEKYLKIFNKIVEDKVTIRDYNFIMLNKKALPRYITLTGTPDLDSEGKVIGVVGTLKDITQLHDMEAQLLQASKMEAVGTLTGGIAHDFNNILQSIMGYSQLLQSRKKHSEQEKIYLENIDELTQRSIRLVRQLLLFSKKVEPHSKIININDEIRSMHNLLIKSISKMIAIKMNLDENIFSINADSAQIGQIIMNLIINARDAIGDVGQIEINTSNLRLNEDQIISNFNIAAGNYVKLTVTDNGFGMNNDILQHIFDPFFTTKEVGKGTGLGLAVVYGVVKSHKGYIYCESEQGKGTIFTILLPALTSVVPPKLIAEPKTKQNNIVGTETILLVDDEESILDTTKDTLELYGYKTITAENGDQALEIYQTQHETIQLVILDLIMPGSGGKKCLMDLVAVNPAVKVLMTSGYSSSQQIEELIKIGAAGFISKPYRPEDLLYNIRKIVDDLH